MTGPALYSAGMSTAAALIAFSLSGVSGQPAVGDDVVARVRQYVAAYEKSYANLLSEERQRQELREAPRTTNVPSAPRAVPGGIPLQETPQTTGAIERRRLRSNYIVVTAATGLGWVPFRDVIEVDGRRVGDRMDRLAALLTSGEAADLARARALVDESTRHDIGAIARTMNMPVLGMLFLHPDRARHVQVARADDDRVGRVRAVVLEFQEVAPPALVRGPGDSDVPSRGRVWFDEEAGVVLKTEHVARVDAVTAVVVVTYRHEPRLGVHVPERMEETYTWAPDGRTLRVESSYHDYRRLDVRIESRPGPPR